MQIKIQSKLNFYSTWLLLIFTLIVLIGSFSSEFFQAPIKTSHELNQYRRLYTDGDFKNIKKISLKNTLGSYELKKLPQGSSNEWGLISPRRLPADDSVMQNFFKSLKNIRIRKVYQNDVINRSNFSLDSPLMKISMDSSENQKANVLKFGLVNPIDNSTYIYTSKNDAIYHIDAINFSFESLDLSDFVDSNIFSIKPQNVAKLKIYRGLPQGNPRFLANHKNEKWFGTNQRPLDEEKLMRFFDELLSLKSLFILDNPSVELKKRVEQFLDNSIYSIEIQDHQGKTHTYQISTVINSLPEIKMEKAKYFIMQASDREYPYLVSKEHLTLFTKRDSQFKGLHIKKIFY